MPAIDPHDFFDEKFRGGRPTPDDLRRLVELLWEAYGESVYLFACAKLRTARTHATSFRTRSWRP